MFFIFHIVNEQYYVVIICFYAVISVLGLLQFIWSHGMRTFSSIWIVVRTLALRKTVLEICSLDCGFQICLCVG